MSESDERLYKTGRVLKRTVRIQYPATTGRIVLRTELDWDKDIEALSVSDDGQTWTFEVEADQPFLYFKPCLVQDETHHWAVGSNNLLLMTEGDRRISYPFFFASEFGSHTPLIEFESKILGRQHKVRAYIPPGYEENTLATYPVVYMQDGQNLFFPEEAFMGSEWHVDESSDTLRAMRAVEDMIVVGIYSGDRMVEYTKPGYEKYAQSLVDEIVPEVDKRLRTIVNRRMRSVWGSSLGGVVSFYSVWQHPDVFGSAVCMSSTFSHKDDLMDRVLTERPPDVGFYLDSGWPEDNYEVTLGMAMALVARGWKFGLNLLHLTFPYATHNEVAWGTRLHLPIQFLFGAVAKAARIGSPVLGEAPYRDSEPRAVGANATP